MVTRMTGLRGLASVLIIAAAAGPAQAQSADWSRAGGDLFVQAVGTAPSEPVDGADENRVAVPLQPYAAVIEAAALRHGLDPKLLHAVVVVESAYRPSVCSPAGACGLAQLMPATALELGVRDRSSPDQSVLGGADYLARQIRRFGDVRLALAAYNSGPERVARLGRVPSIPETQTYVSAVIDCFLALNAGRSIRSARDCRPGSNDR